MRLPRWKRKRAAPRFLIKVLSQGNILECLYGFSPKSASSCPKMLWQMYFWDKVWICRFAILFP